MAKTGRKPRIKTKEEIMIEVLEKKVKEMKAMLQCMKIVLMPSGTFRACAGCDDQFLCRQIKNKIENKIRNTYNMAEDMIFK